MAMVSSKCAAQLPSAVTAVQRSSSTRTSHEPIVIMGSMASTMPALSTGPASRVAEVRDLRLLVERPADAVAHEGAHHPEAVALAVGLHRVGDVAEPVARPALHDGLVQALPGDVEELLHPRRHRRPPAA